MKQREIHFTIPNTQDEPRYVHVQRQREFNNPVRRVPAETLFARLLKRLAARAMTDATECPPDALPAHVARLRDFREIFAHVIGHEFKGTPEARPSGKQLLHPSTLHDYAACIEITLKDHRAPAFVNRGSEQYEGIIRRLDTLAGLLQRRGIVDAILEEDGQ